MSFPRDTLWLWLGRVWEGGEKYCLAEELQRAESIRNTERRLEFLCGRAVARLGAAEIMNVDPMELVISTNEEGRPALDGQASGILDFSISHSKEFVAVLFGAGGKVGVDVETGPVSNDIDALARRFFLAREKEYVMKAGAENRAVFRKIWACKEALAKCSGRKLWQVLKEFEVKMETFPMSVGAGYWLHEIGDVEGEGVCMAATDFEVSCVYSLELPRHS